MFAMTLSGHGPRRSTLSPQAWAFLNKGLVALLAIIALVLDATFGLTALGLGAAMFFIGQMNGRNQANELRTTDYEKMVQLEARKSGVALGAGDPDERMVRRQVAAAFQVRQLPRAPAGEEEIGERDG